MHYLLFQYTWHKNKYIIWKFK